MSLEVSANNQHYGSRDVLGSLTCTPAADIRGRNDGPNSAT